MTATLYKYEKVKKKNTSKEYVIKKEVQYLKIFKEDGARPNDGSEKWLLIYIVY